MTIHLLSGFLGSGKTTAIEQACKYLINSGRSVGVISNDQGAQLVDGAFFNYHNIPNRQVIDGCFCCNYQDFENSVASLVEVNRPDVIFAESVGSCTDIVATVIKPLLKYTQNKTVTLSTFADIRLLHMLLKDNGSAFHESVGYIYFKQLEEAAIIIVTKVDLADEQLLTEVKQILAERYSEKLFLFQNSRDPADIKSWLDILDTTAEASKLGSLQIDYATYGEGEAQLAWFDQEIDIYSAENASQDAVRIIQAICDKIGESKSPVGHLKFLIDGKTKISFTRISDKQDLDDLHLEKKLYTKLLINARVQTTPEMLSALINEAVQGVRSALGCFVIVKSTASFQPGFPKPTHRILA